MHGTGREGVKGQLQLRSKEELTIQLMADDMVSFFKSINAHAVR